MPDLVNPVPKEMSVKFTPSELRWFEDVRRVANFVTGLGEIKVLTDAASIDTDGRYNHYFKVTLEGNRTIANPTNLTIGNTYYWIIIQDGTGSRTLAYGSSFLFPGGSIPVLSTGAGDIDLLTGVVLSSTQILATMTKDHV